MTNLDKYKKEFSKEDQKLKKPTGVDASNVKEATGLYPNNLPNPTDNAGKFLTAMLGIVPFFSLFEYIANQHYSGKIIVNAP